MNGETAKFFHKLGNFNFPLGVPPLDPQYWPKEWTEIYHKEYPRMPKIKLAEKILNLDSLEDCLYRRYSKREYDVNLSVSLEELSTILFYSAAVNSQRKDRDQKGEFVRRFYPSGGARYPLEIYLGIQRVGGIAPGIYHYNVKSHLLEELTSKEKEMERMREGLFYPWSRDAAVVFFITAVWNRNFMKYRDRGYRIVLMEAGHLAQNISLVAASLKIGCCNSVGFQNERIEEVLDIKNDDEDSLYMTLLGK